MTRRALAGVSATVIACIIVWVLRGIDRAPVDVPERDEVRNSANSIEVQVDSASVVHAKDKGVSGKVPDPAAQLQAHDTAEVLPSMEEVSEQQKNVDDYLSAHNRDARSLLQAFRATKANAYLDEALQRFPDDPIVLFHGVLYNADPTEERKAMLLRLQQLLPDDAMPSYLLGEQLLKEGNNAAALELLMAGSLKPSSTTYANEMINDHLAFLVASGVPQGDALAQASYGVEMRLLTPMRNLGSLLLDIHADVSAQDDGAESAKMWAIVGARIAERMQNQMSQFLVEVLSGMSIEKKFLSLLPPETELVAGGTTVVQRTEKIEEMRALVRSLSLVPDAAFLLPTDEKRLFFTRLHEEGELSALRWLSERDQ